MTVVLADELQIIDQAALVEVCGTVREVRGLAMRVADLPAPVGAMVRIEARRARTTVPGEVIGFDNDQTIVMPFGAMAGISRGDRVVTEDFAQLVGVGESLLGRVLNGLGEPIDSKGPIRDLVLRPLNPPPIDPLNRPRIDTPLATGVRAVDAVTTIGRGQRMGVFASPGVGKSTLLGMMARHTAADVNVIALVGERGREVRDFLELNLGDESLARTVVICATGDEPALMRIRAALVATSVAEYFRDQGADVLLIMDSVTRFCQAQRQVGLAAGEPPATKGYPPSVFATLPMLLERSGRTGAGSITGLYAVLVEGDELTDPVTDASRGILDGHIMLSQTLAHKGHWPAVDVLRSISRVADEIISADHITARSEVLRLLNAYTEVEDLLTIGAYHAGNNSDFDLAIECKPDLDAFLQQGRTEAPAGDDAFDATRQQLFALYQQIQQIAQRLQQRQAGARVQAPNAPRPRTR